MKVLLVHKYWRTLSGAEMYFHDVERLLRAQGHQVKIFTTNFNCEGGIDEKEIRDDVIYGEPVNYLHGSMASRITNLPALIYNKKNKALMSKLLSEFKPDIVHCFSLYIVLSPSILDACREANIPVVMSCNDYKHICTNYRLYHHGKICMDCKGGKLYMPIINNCCKHSFAFSVASSLESMVHEFLNIHRKNIHTFLFESKFMLNTTREFWGTEKKYNLEFLGKPFHAPTYQAHPDCEDYILFMGRLSDEKGVEVLLNAMKLVPEAKLKVVGRGPHEQSLKELAQTLELKNVDFAGSIWGDAAKDQIRNSRFVVLPSLWHENFSYVITETFALGKALLGSDTGGTPENIIPNKTGNVYPAHDHTKLAEHIRNMWNDKEGTRQMGMNAKKLVDENFNDTVFSKRLNEIYTNVINSYHKRSKQ